MADPKKEDKKWEREFSAGGVVARESEEGPQVLLIMPNKHNEHAPTGKWRLPKGMVEAKESPSAAAEREVFEETGIRSRAEADLGEDKYPFRFQGRNIFKIVRYYLMRYEAGEPRPDPLEVFEVRWVPILSAINMLGYKGEKEMVARALQIILH